MLKRTPSNLPCVVLQTLNKCRLKLRKKRFEGHSTLPYNDAQSWQNSTLHLPRETITYYPDKRPANKENALQSLVLETKKFTDSLTENPQIAKLIEISTSMEVTTGGSVNWHKNIWGTTRTPINYKLSYIPSNGNNKLLECLFACHFN